MLKILQKAAPPDFDPAIYKAKNPDLQDLDDQTLLGHWISHGRREGRLASEAALREHFTKLAKRHAPIIEIGPFVRPCLRGKGVFYFDVLSQDDLNARAKTIGMTGVSAPSIDFVSPNGDLSVIDRTFAAAISSHCIEHTPCLIKHLNDLSNVLQPSGRYFLLIPDKRYCFDHFIDVSTIADVLLAHSEQRTVHTLASVIEHRALTTHNVTPRHWNGDHADPGFLEGRVDRLRRSIGEYEAANGRYIDVHAWQFTPDSFSSIIVDLNGMSLIDLAVERVYQTPHGRNEFCAILQKPGV